MKDMKSTAHCVNSVLVDIPRDSHTDVISAVIFLCLIYVVYYLFF